MQCPKCSSTLVKCQNEFGNFWHCGLCEGTAITISLLRKFVHRDTINQIWQGAKQQEYPRKYKCLGCNQYMEEVPVNTPAGMYPIDVCTHCHFIWLDAREWEYRAGHTSVAHSRDLFCG